MEKELAIITVIGKDRVGIIANISGLLAKNNINIEDVSQKVLEGFFVMNMVINIKESKIGLGLLRQELSKICSKLNLKVQLQHENILKHMQRL